MSDVERVLIVGGGIAGMALAIVLQRVASRLKSPRSTRTGASTGAGITITGPTLRALDRLGLLDAVVNEGYCYDATRICDAAGNVILASRVSGRPMGPRIPNGGGILRPVLPDAFRRRRRALGRYRSLGVSVAIVLWTGPPRCGGRFGFTDAEQMPPT